MRSINDAEYFLGYALSIGALRVSTEAEFRLRNDRKSPYFFDTSRFYNGASIYLLAEAYAGIVFEHYLGHDDSKRVDVLFGSAYKGIPIVATVTKTLFARYGVNLDFAFDRKEEKDHGEGGTIVGEDLSGKNVLILDDVMTSGGSVSEACSLIKRQGGNPVGCVVAFDRQECVLGSKETARQRSERDHGIEVHAISQLKDLIGLLKKSDVPSEKAMARRLLAYRE